jgi:hypothetical protein
MMFVRNAEISLSDKYWRTAQRKQAAAEELRDFVRTRNRISGMDYRLFISKYENFSIDKLAECKLAGKTLFELVMAVVDFVFSLRVLVVAVFFGQLFFQMPERVHRRIQYCEQYGKAKQELDEDRFFQIKRDYAR